MFTPEAMSFEQALPVIFMILMGISMLAYVILDGYDLGVGALMGYATPDEKDTMVASIGPFWDANETWLVLGVGILLVAFPMAHGVVLGELYLPVTLMLFSLIIRGVAFDFRVKVPADKKHLWNKLFVAGSVGAALSQGYMLGSYITGFHDGALSTVFAMLTALCLLAGYVLMGSTWLLMKTTGALQLKAVTWASRSLWLAGLGIAAISLVTPFISTRIFEKWFAVNNFFLLMPIPLATLGLFFIADRALRRLPSRLSSGNEYGAWVPFACAVGVFFLSFYGLAYSLFPYLVLDKIDVWQAASHHDSLLVIFWGVVVVLPAILGYTVYAYRVFWGKAQCLSYN
ncbi:cytochrome d ubiquinol oxidase subunit II [Limnobacter sp. MED105]|uniref:cytochrome d ubiquinol oxidase subunit II n=1 Tax=Limnobacter sp. MED105 TaxID=391597 RepID=UPI000156CA88|nr:cytochrome d ubiquinol oxidase subunit II [Limnobacter sp. MED105]EDM83223.1 cytochrome d ubiquinol oxidase, subunit II [Limnobacter sp. MED105]